MSPWRQPVSAQGAKTQAKPDIVMPLNDNISRGTRAAEDQNINQKLNAEEKVYRLD